MTMRLRFSPTSPFVRKVTIVLAETGMTDRVELAPADVWAESDLTAENPLGKIPSLLTDGGEALYDSRVICEYLDSLHDGAKLFPPSGGARWTALRRQALADGILDAAILALYETSRRTETQRWPGWIVRQTEKIDRGLDAFEQEELGDAFTIGEISLAAVLGYLDFRFPDKDWRASHPKLAEWFSRVSLRPSMAATVPHA